jgi:ribosome-associated protein
MTHPEDDNIEYELVSKSEMKREMHRWQALGERLLSLRADQLATVPITERLALALEESKRVTQREARRRHLQLIGKLMRDNDVDAIRDAVDRLDPSTETYKRYQQQAEAWRERLIRNDNAESEWFETYPDTDRQPFRSLVRAARKEQSDDPAEPIRAGKNGKRLLRWIKDIVGEPSNLTG